MRIELWQFGALLITHSFHQIYDWIPSIISLSIYFRRRKSQIFIQDTYKI
ncbi:hypothetical protein [Nostoc sp.]